MRPRHDLKECDGATGAVVAWAVSTVDGVALKLRAGDRVHCRAGRIWLTFEGHLDDIVLGCGESHRVGFEARAMVSGFGPAGIEIERAPDVPQTVRRWRVRPSLLLKLQA